MKQTAVQWLIEHLNLDETSPNYNKLIIEQAKEMEKEQIMDAAKIMLEGKVILFNSTEIGDRRAEQYYNKQFKQQ
jgi:hypothetical protein